MSLILLSRNDDPELVKSTPFIETSTATEPTRLLGVLQINCDVVRTVAEVEEDPNMQVALLPETTKLPPIIVTLEAIPEQAEFGNKKLIKGEPEERERTQGQRQRNRQKGRGKLVPMYKNVAFAIEPSPPSRSSSRIELGPDWDGGEVHLTPTVASYEPAA